LPIYRRRLLRCRRLLLLAVEQDRRFRLFLAMGTRATSCLRQAVVPAQRRARC